MREKIDVLKFNSKGVLRWYYEGELVERGNDWLTLEAFFDRNDMPFMGVLLKRGDRFVETYYSNRWYNIFEIHDRDDDALKGWYCNVTRPARFKDGLVEYDDLLLDLWVSAEGEQTILDEDEYLMADLDEATRCSAREALAELQALFENK